MALHGCGMGSANPCAARATRLAWDSVSRRLGPAVVARAAAMTMTLKPTADEPLSAEKQPRGQDCRGSIRFCRTAYIAASMRVCSCSFSRMLRTWFFTVFSVMYSF